MSTGVSQKALSSVVSMDPVISHTSLSQGWLDKPSRVKGLDFPVCPSESFHIREVKRILKHIGPQTPSIVGCAIRTHSEAISSAPIMETSAPVTTIPLNHFPSQYITIQGLLT